ncbi:MAG: DUF6475 domain-containing protein [Campylobacteraceae bacterium]|jgi:hypothetical protein|nr:DUF6475 domain-containing protein [Campylobacteraceae bacterium]
MTRVEMISQLSVIAEAYHEKVSEARYELYYQVLKELDYEEFKKACIDILSTRKYSSFPMPAEFLNIEEIESKAMSALGELKSAFRRYGRYRSVCFRDKALMACVDAMGGWIALCNMDINDWSFRTKEFVNFYKAFAKRPNDIETTHLSGLVEYQNGIEFAEVALIGFGDNKIISADEFQEFLLPKPEKSIQIGGRKLALGVRKF